MEFSGFPLKVTDDSAMIVQTIHKECNVEYNQEDIQEIYTKRGKGNLSLVVKYAKLEMKIKIQKATKVKRLKAKDIGFKLSALSVYANDSLSAFSRKLFWLTRQAKIEQKWKGAWIFKGQIYVKINEEGEAINIKSEADIITLIK